LNIEMQGKERVINKDVVSFPSLTGFLSSFWGYLLT
jgi:hypothetical protein